MDTDWSIDGWEYIAAEKAGGGVDPRDIRKMDLVNKAPETARRVELGEITSVDEAYEEAKIELGVL